MKKNDKQRNLPSDLDQPGYSNKSYRPGYEVELQEASEEDLKRGFQKGGG